MQNKSCYHISELGRFVMEWKDSGDFDPNEHWSSPNGCHEDCPACRSETKVIFRRWPKKQGGDVIALFPALAGTNDLFTCSSYQTIGQHGAASVGLVNDTCKAKPEEYADLHAELERIGYRLRIAHKFTRADLEERRKQLTK